MPGILICFARTAGQLRAPLTFQCMQSGGDPIRHCIVIGTPARTMSLSLKAVMKGLSKLDSARQTALFSATDACCWPMCRPYKP